MVIFSFGRGWSSDEYFCSLPGSSLYSTRRGKLSLQHFELISCIKIPVVTEGLRLSSLVSGFPDAVVTVSVFILREPTPLRSGGGSPVGVQNPGPRQPRCLRVYDIQIYKFSMVSSLFDYLFIRGNCQVGSCTRLSFKCGLTRRTSRFGSTRTGYTGGSRLG